MEKQFALLSTTRKNILDYTSVFTIEELNFIPPHFNNNIIWHAGHVLATPQMILYGLAGLNATVYLDFVDRYKKGTKPEKFIGQEEWNFIRENLIHNVATISEDYRQKRFQNFRKYETSYGAVLENIDDAIAYTNVHEGMHFGFIKALGKVLGK